MSNEKCMECTNELVDKYGDLQLKYERALQHIQILNQCLDTKEELNEFYRREIELLEEQNKILFNKLV